MNRKSSQLIEQIAFPVVVALAILGVWIGILTTPAHRCGNACRELSRVASGVKSN